MTTRTWPYGTQKRVEILKAGRKPIRGSNEDETKLAFTVSCREVDPPNEGHFIIGGQHAFIPEAGMFAMMEFTEGGPNGGYWRLIRRIPAPR